MAYDNSKIKSNYPTNNRILKNHSKYNSIFIIIWIAKEIFKCQNDIKTNILLIIFSNFIYKIIICDNK